MAPRPARTSPSPGKTRRRAPSQERSLRLVQSLLDATAQVLNEVGLEQLSTNKVAKRANVAVGSIYQYFPDKEALVDALVEDRMHKLGDLTERRMADLATYSFSAATDAMLRAIIDFLSEEPGLVLVLMSHALSAPDKGVAGQLRALADTVSRAYLEPLDERAVADLDIAIFVSTTVAGLFGGVLANPAVAPDYRERVIPEVVRMLSTWMTQPTSSLPSMREVGT